MISFKTTGAFGTIDWKWRLDADFCTNYPDKSVTFKNEWVEIKQGIMIISKGYAWDGCTPKWEIGGVIIGTYDGPVYDETGKQYAYYASLVHDALYQFCIGKRRVADREFKARMKGWKFRQLYYLAVRHFGWIGWNKNKRNLKNG